MLRRNLANIITITRIIGSIIMFFLEPLSAYFYLVYIYSGISDAIDGYVARSTNTTSALGSKLDSVSDLLFYSVMMFKIMPILLDVLPAYIWYLINIIVIVRMSMYLFVGIKRKQIMSNHTLLNKLTGFLLFLVPFMIITDFFIPYALIVTIVALIAALYEIYYLHKH